MFASDCRKRKKKKEKQKFWGATISEFSKLTSTKIFSKHTGCLNHFGKIPYALDMLILSFYRKAVSYCIGMPFSL